MHKFYLRDTRTNLGSNAMFWAIGGSYTSNVLNAEVFDRESALGQHESRSTDLPVPVESITPYLRTRFDMQYLPSQATSQGLCVLINMDRFDGNDCYFMKADGTFTYDFDLALRTTYDNAKALTANYENQRIRIYHVEGLLSRLRKSVAYKHCDAAEMAKAGNYQGCKKCGASNY